MDREELDQFMEQAARLLDEGQFQEALDKLDSLPQPPEDPEDRVEWSTMRGWALAELHRVDEALEVIEPLLDEFPENARLHCTRGFSLLQADAISEAIEALEHAYELDPQDELTITNLAYACERIRDFNRACELYDSAIDLGIGIDWALTHKAAALAHAGDLESAAKTLKRYLSLQPDDVDQWSELAILYADLGQLEAAFGAFEQAVLHAPDAAEPRMNFGLTLARAGKTEEARAQLDEIVRIEGRQVRAQLLEAAILEVEGHTRRAEQAYERVLAGLDPQNEDDLVFALERAMDFFSRHKNRKRCEELLRRAYSENACTVELCESYREIETRFAKKAYWLSVVIEADYRKGLREAYTHHADRTKPRKRYLRNFQVVARDRDDAVAMVLDLATRMGEKRARVREIVREEAVDDAYTGLYEIERDAVVLAAEN